MKMSLLSLKKVSHYFGKLKVIDDISLSLNSGELRAIIGPNGCGKTTLFNIISGGLTPYSGKINFLGKCLYLG